MGLAGRCAGTDSIQEMDAAREDRFLDALTCGTGQLLEIRQRRGKPLNPALAAELMIRSAKVAEKWPEVMRYRRSVDAVDEACQLLARAEWFGERHSDLRSRGMPRKRKPAQPRHTHPDLAETLVEELRTEGVSSTPAVPTIYEEEQPHGNDLHVTVIWSRWVGVPTEERGAIILDAYVRAGLEAETRRITLALGRTPEEAESLRVEY